MHELNEAQSRAVTQGDGHALVLAGAGTGKTRVIVERMAWLVDERGLNPRQLLALTFTNRAAREMKARTAARLGLDSLGAWVGTFHSFSAYVLRRHIHLLGRKTSFTIVDRADQQSVLKRLIKEGGTRYHGIAVRAGLAAISRFKQAIAGSSGPERSWEDEGRGYEELWEAYDAALARANALDFDDLLVFLARLLDEHPSVREAYGRRYQYVHVDEYQDTNRAQYLIAKRLSQDNGNLFVVGDEDQSIYSWRGANIRNILEFERDFPDASVFRLEQNYRSTEAILEVANAVVAKNEGRLGKRLWTAKSGGDAVRLYAASDGGDEARFVVDRIKESALPLGDTAVLFRTNGQARLIEEALRRENLPYVVVGAVQFYGRKEIKDLLAYLHLLVNPADDVSLRRVLNVPPRGLGRQTVERLEAYASARKVPLGQVLLDVEHDETFSARVRLAIRGFTDLLDELRREAQERPVGELVTLLLDRASYRDYLERADDTGGGLEIVDEFVSGCAQFDARNAGGLSVFLEETALMSDTDQWEADAPAVSLMTCHSAKGLEFPQVFLIGLEEGLLPHASALDSAADLEEERRLCYVAMTRAHRLLTLSCARSRVVYGESMGRTPSRFLQEIPEGRLDVVGRETGTKDRGVQPRPGPAKAESARIQRGVRVRHARFGPGVVMQTMGSGKKLRARIRFESGRSRVFLVSAAPLEILERGEQM